MDKICYRNPWKSEVIGHCCGMKIPNDHAEPTKVERKKDIKKINKKMPVYDNTYVNTGFTQGRIGFRKSG